jgi:hypothetical protein
MTDEGISVRIQVRIRNLLRRTHFYPKPEYFLETGNYNS